MTRPDSNLLTLALIVLLPVLACCAIVLFDAGVKGKLLVDLFITFAIFGVIAGALSFGAARLENRSHH